MTVLKTKVNGLWTEIAGDVSPIAQVPQNVLDFVSFWTPTAWITLPFAANWNDLNATYSCFYRKVGDIVELRGLATRRNSIGNALTTIAQMPAGYFPTGRVPYFTGNRGDTNTSGQLYLEAGALKFNGTAPHVALPVDNWVSLDQVRYSVLP